MTFTPQFWVQTAAVFVAALAAFVAYYGIRRQTARARAAMGMDLLFRLLAAWDDKPMRTRRARLARELEHAKPLDPSSATDPHLTRNAVDVLNSFEYLGFLVITSKAITIREARKTLAGFAVPYWLIFQSTIADYVASERAPEKERRIGGTKPGNPAPFDQLRELVRLTVEDQYNANQGRPCKLAHALPISQGELVHLTPEILQTLRGFREAEASLGPEGTEAEAAGNLPTSS